MMNRVSAVQVPAPIRPRPPRGRRATDFLVTAPREVPPARLSRSAPSFERDVMRGLGLPQKAIPATWLHGACGGGRLEPLARPDVHDPARSEIRILERCAGQIAEAAGPRPIVVELGGVSGGQTRLLLAALDAPQAYLPIQPTEQFLAESVAVAHLPSMFTGLRVLPIVADFTRLDALPELALLDPGAGDHGRCLVFCPGSTIARFAPDEAIGWLTRIGRAVGPDALLVVGAGTTPDTAGPITAQDDRGAADAVVDTTLLMRINRELGADFSPSAFRHEVRFDAAQQRVETHLVSRYTQRVTVCGRPIRFAMGESIHAGNAYPYGLLKVQQLAARAGWSHRQLWIDGPARFAVHVLEPSQAEALPRERNVMFR